MIGSDRLCPAKENIWEKRPFKIASDVDMMSREEWFSDSGLISHDADGITPDVSALCGIAVNFQLKLSNGQGKLPKSGMPKDISRFSVEKQVVG